MVARPRIRIRAIAKKSLELQALIRFGVGRMNASVADALGGDLSWERFFGVSGLVLRSRT